MKAVIESISVVVDAIESHIKEIITSGALKPGQQLPSERDLQKQSASPPAAKRSPCQARLQALGLIRIHHGKGARSWKTTRARRR